MLRIGITTDYCDDGREKRFLPYSLHDIVFKSSKVVLRYIMFYCNGETQLTLSYELRAKEKWHVGIIYSSKRYVVSHITAQKSQPWRCPLYLWQALIKLLQDYLMITVLLV